MSDSLPSDQVKMEPTETEPSNENLKRQVQTRLGQRLHAARERKEMTITEAATTLRIQKGYLQGLEDGDWSKLPEEVYALGFLRQYAAFLGEDLHEGIELLKPGSYQLTKPFTMPDPPIAPNKMWAIAAGILFVLLFILFNAMEDGDNKSVAPEAPPILMTPAPSEDTAIKQSMPEKGGHVAAPSATLPATALSVPDGSVVDTGAEAMKQPQNAAPALSTPVVANTHRYRLTAIDASAWLQVHDPSGILIKEALLHPGQSLRLESSAPFLTVTCGNAAALQIEVDGTLYAAAGTLGAPEKVLHGFRIETSGHDD